MNLGDTASSTKAILSKGLSGELSAINTPNSWGTSASIPEEGDLGT